MKPGEAPGAGRRKFSVLESEATARRNRLAGNLDELSGRMRPANLFAEGKTAIWSEVDRITDEVVSMGEDLVHDSVDWVKDNRGLALGGTATALLAAGLVWYASRKRTVPLYAAYGMEDPGMMDDKDDNLGGAATAGWGRVQGEAQHLGDRAGEAYHAARSRAAELSDAARERAAHAADIARDRAHEAAELAREAADRAREAAVEAGRWAQKQPRENPATVVLVALAAGAIIGALIPSAGRRRT